MNAALGQSEMKRISLAPESTFDCSSSLFSTLDSKEISPIIKPNPPLKKLKTTNYQQKLPTTITSPLSSSSDTIIGDIHPSNMDLDNLDDLSNPGSPLDRSTPISDYEMGVDEMGVNETEVGTGTLNSSGSTPGQAETSSQENIQEQKSPFTIRTKDYRVSPPPPRNFL